MKRRERGAATVGVLALLSAGVVIRLAPGVRTGTDTPSALAREGSFVETVVESGTLAASRLMLYAAPVGAGPSKIVELAREGSVVGAGDVLVRFDATPTQQTLAREDAALTAARSELGRVRGDLQLEALAVQEDHDTTRQQAASAQSDLADEMNGKGRVAVLEAESALGDASREVERTQTAFEDLKPLLAEGFVTRAELDRAGQAAGRAAEQRRLAAARLDALTRYERPAAVDRAKARVAHANDGLSRFEEAAGARLGQRQAAIALAASRVDEIAARVAQLRAGIDRAVIRAERPGLVVYRELFFGSDRRKPQIGDETWPNQPILAVPDTGDLVVDTRIREIDLHRVAASQRVAVRVDAYPDLVLPATVSLVGALAEQDAARAGAKFFPVTVTLSGSDGRLRTGMTARVEIVVRSLPRTLLVPAAAVFGDAADPHCYVVRHGHVERRALTLAGRNDTDVAIAGGLAAGDRVLLIEPGTAGSTP